MAKGLGILIHGDWKQFAWPLPAKSCPCLYIQQHDVAASVNQETKTSIIATVAQFILETIVADPDFQAVCQMVNKAVLLCRMNGSLG